MSSSTVLANSHLFSHFHSLPSHNHQSRFTRHKSCLLTIYPDQSTYQPANHPFTQSIIWYSVTNKYPTSQPTNQINNQPTTYSPTQPTNQPTNQPISQPTNQSTQCKEGRVGPSCRLARSSPFSHRPCLHDASSSIIDIICWRCWRSIVDFFDGVAILGRDGWRRNWRQQHNHTEVVLGSAADGDGGGGKGRKRPGVLSVRLAS